MERTLFIFKDGDNQLIEYTNRFYSVGLLLNRLISQKFIDKKLKLVNIHFYTEKTYELYPMLIKHYTHRAGKVLWHNAVFQYDIFKTKTFIQQKEYLWEESCRILQEACLKINDLKLLDSVKFAYEEGVRLNLNTDYILVANGVVLHNVNIVASLWIRFKEDYMAAELSLEKKGKLFFTREIDRSRNGIEFFLEMFKGIQSQNNSIVIKGHRDVDYLPLIIPIDVNLIPGVEV